MKSLLLQFLVFLCFAFLQSCTPKTSPTNQSIDTHNIITPDSLPPIKDNHINNSTSSLAYEQFPFGCPTLVNFVFSDEWRIIDHSGTREMGFSIYQRALLDINKCLQQINTQPPIQRPKIKKVNYLRYNSHDSLACDNIASTDSIIIKLPNMGRYKSYYAYGNLHNENPSDTIAPEEGCFEYGNLVLVDSVSNSAKVINLYLMKQKEDKIFLRLFYIDAESLIHIMEVNCNTTNCFITNRFTASVDNNGSFRVNKK